LVPTTQDIAGEYRSTEVDLLERGEELARIEQAIPCGGVPKLVTV